MIVISVNRTINTEYIRTSLARTGWDDENQFESNVVPAVRRLFPYKPELKGLLRPERSLKIENEKKQQKNIKAEF